MDSLSDVTLEQFRPALTDTAVRTFQVIQGAIGAGIVFFFVILIVSQSAPVQADGDSVELVKIMTAINAFIAAGVYFASNILFNTMFSEKRLQEAVTKTFYNQQRQPITDPAEKCLAQIRTAVIVRLALWEAPALFGLVICMIGSMNGVIHEHPFYWINLIPSLIHVGLVVMTFPNRERLEEIFTAKISRQN